jgi:hypothetical protein
MKLVATASDSAAAKAVISERTLDKVERDYANRYHPRPLVFRAEDHVATWTADIRNSSRGLPPLRQQRGSRLISAIADDRFGEIPQCVAALHSAGLSDGKEAARGHLSLGAAIAKDDLAQLHGNA